MNSPIPTNSDTPSKGKLQINVTSEINHFPVSGANIRISYTGIPDSTVEEVTTDSSGQSETLELDAPPVWTSLQKNSLIRNIPFLSLLRDLKRSALPAQKSLQMSLPSRTYRCVRLILRRRGKNGS